MKQVHLLLVIIIFSALTFCLPPPPTQQQCSKYYSASLIPQQCSNYICNFPYGIFSLLSNTANEDNLQFSLCIYLPQHNITISSNQTDAFGSLGSIFIQGYQITIGSELEGYSLTSENQLIIQANTSLSLISTQLITPSIWFETMNNINIQNSNIQYEQSIESFCKCFVEESNCSNDEWADIFPRLYSQKTDNFSMESFDNFSYTNFSINSVIIASKQNLLLTNSTIKNSIIALYTSQLKTQNSSLSTLGLGYASDSGLGCGYFDHLLNNLLGCTGSGGSHGGSGGNSSPNNCNLVMSRIPYGSAKFPTTPGSGGGYYFWESKQASSGGGVVNIQVLSLVSNQTTINAKGGVGIQDGGGGSGGSISLDFSLITGNITIQASGGDGKSSGGGGRVRYWNHNWKNAQTYNSLALKLEASSGGQCTGLGCGSNGSIFISPCPRGYQISWDNYLCQYCPLGTFQQKYGYDKCIDCSSLIPNSQYVPSNQIGYNANCNIVCKNGYTLVDNQCLNSFYFVISHIGGLNVLIALCIIIAVVILYLLIVMIRKLTEKDVFWNYGQRMNSFSSAKNFHIQQIPFHVMRVYLSGTNTQFDPWSISRQCEQKLYQKLGQSYTRAIPFLKMLFAHINKASKYSKFQIILIIILKIYYYPLSRVLRDKFKQKKCNIIFKKTTRLNSKIPEFQKLGIKFSVKPYNSIGSIEILDYSKSVYDFYIENYFPMVFLLEQYPLGDYTIDFSDPFIKAFINELSRKEEKTKNLSKYIIHLSQLLKQKKNTMTILNHLWNINQYETRLQAYLWQPPNRILGVDKQFVIDPKVQLFLIFNNQKKNQSSHFMHKQNIPNIHFGEVETLKHRMDYLRKQTIVTERKYPLLEIKNHYNQKLLTWFIGIISILLLLSSVFSFFMVIFILSEHQITFYYGISIYFILFPFIDFILSFINLRMILAKSQKMLSYGIFFSIGIIAKFSILSLCGVIQIARATTTFLQIVEGIWLAQFLLGIISLYLSMLINPHITRSNRKD